MKKSMVSILLMCLLLATATGCSKEKQQAAEEQVTETLAEDTNVLSAEKSTNVSASEETTDISAAEETTDIPASEDNTDIPASTEMLDLTQFSSTMVYSEVYNIMVNPGDYMGRTIKMNGLFSVYEDDVTGQIYFACIIQDATACCAQGIEFILKGDYSYPEDYPAPGEEVTVTGEFETYYEGENLYCRLKDAEMIF